MNYVIYCRILIPAKPLFRYLKTGFCMALFAGKHWYSRFIDCQYRKVYLDMFKTKPAVEFVVSLKTNGSILDIHELSEDVLKIRKINGIKDAYLYF